MTRSGGRLAVPLAALWALVVAAWAGGAWGHPPVGAVAAVRVASDGEVVVELTHDVLAFALNDTSANIPDGPMFELLNGPEERLVRALEESRTRFVTLCVLEADGVRVPWEVTASPSAGDVWEWKQRHRSYPLPIKLELVARAVLPAGAKGFTVRFPEMLGDVLVSVERPGEELTALPLKPNERSPEFSVVLRGGAGDDLGVWGVFRRFVALGFHHILPEGADHCLFVLGLFLLSPRVRPVLVQISAFTVAHTLTLTLASLNIIGLPSWVVEPAIAASIAFVGVENLVATKVDAKRTVVAFVFGLVHGLGVATAFNEAKLPSGQLVSGLAAFTVGVEAGHVAVLAGAFLVLGWFRDRSWYRARVAVPLSLAISAVAVVWFVQRVGWPG